MTPTPPLIALAALDAQLRTTGYAVVSAATVGQMATAASQTLAAWSPFWEDLPADAYLKDGGRYRRRRHGCFVIEGGRVLATPHRAHWQPVSYNALHGGLERWFEPLPAALAKDAAWLRLLYSLATHASALRGQQPWYAEAHTFRIDTTDGIGRPTPEGAHRDGVDLVAVLLIGRQNVKGGETRVFDADGPQGQRFTLTEPFSALLLDDERVIHESTPIQPQDPTLPAHRDTLVITLRAGGFQAPAILAE